MYPSSEIYLFLEETNQEDRPFNIAILKHIHPKINPSPPKGVRIPRAAGTGTPEVIRADII
jgi:hypothetical protein